jgi:hypothetical protein
LLGGPASSHSQDGTLSLCKSGVKEETGGPAWIELDCWASLHITMWRTPLRSAVISNVEQTIGQSEERWFTFVTTAGALA